MSDGSLIHEQIEQYLATRPEFRNRMRQTGDGEYDIDGRDVKVGFCRQGYLVVHDGPLRQPFTDYVEKKESTAIYHNEGLKNSSLNTLPKETRISFGDEGNRYSRLDAMKVAKEQAIFREKAATYQNEGQIVPQDLREKYEKTIDIKLGNRQMQRQRPRPQAPMEPAPGPAWWPGGPAAVPAAGVVPAPPMPAPPPAAVASVTQRPSYAPLPVMPGTPQALAQKNLFGQVPDLFQMAAARFQAPGTGTVSVPAGMTRPVSMFTGGCAQAPLIGLQQPGMQLRA